MHRKLHPGPAGKHGESDDRHVPNPIGKLILQVTGAAAKLAGRTTLLTPDKGSEFFQPAWTCSPARLEQLTGWTAKHDFRTGTRITAEWYRRNKWL